MGRAPPPVTPSVWVTSGPHRPKFNCFHTPEPREFYRDRGRRPPPTTPSRHTCWGQLTSANACGVLCSNTPHCTMSCRFKTQHLEVQHSTGAKGQSCDGATKGLTRRLVARKDHDVDEGAHDSAVAADCEAFEEYSPAHAPWREHVELEERVHGLVRLPLIRQGPRRGGGGRQARRGGGTQVRRRVHVDAQARASSRRPRVLRLVDLRRVASRKPVRRRQRPSCRVARAQDSGAHQVSSYWRSPLRRPSGRWTTRWSRRTTCGSR